MTHATQIAHLLILNIHARSCWNVQSSKALRRAWGQANVKVMARSSGLVRLTDFFISVEFINVSGVTGRDVSVNLLSI